MFLKNIIRLLFILPFYGLNFLYGARRTRKWMKKNEKMQNPDHHDFMKRWDYITSKAKTLTKALGIKVKVVNEDYKPKGSFLIVSNHSSNFDGFYLLSILKETSPSTSIAKESLSRSTVRGYFEASESFYVYYSNPRKTLLSFNKAGDWAKQNNRGIVIFPEGKRIWNSEIASFAPSAFKLSHRNYLPIIPVSIVGTVEARKWYSLKTREISIIFHKPIKASESIKLSTIKLAEKTQAIIKKDLDNYENSFSGKALIKHQKEKDRLAKKQIKYEIKIEKRNKKYEKKGK